MSLAPDVLRQIIREQLDEVDSFTTLPLVARDQLATAQKMLAKPWIKVVLGVRRSGKSSFCHQLLRGQVYGYLNFDDERLLGIKGEDLNHLLQLVLETRPGAKFLFFDEIQNVPGWELFVNRLHRQGYNLVITGSNSKLLGKELATHLTGRHVSMELHPFSFAEFLRAREFSWRETDFGRSEKRAAFVAHLTAYVQCGGFPEMVTHGYDPHYLRALYDKIISRDIVDRYAVKYTRTLKEVALYAFSNQAGRVTFHKIRKAFELKSVHTVKNYVQYLEDVYLLSLVPAFSFKVKEQLTQARKLYTIDNGMSRAISPKFMENRGASLENLVHQELRRRGAECYYWAAPDTEVDFALREGRELAQLIQVCFTLHDPDTRKREMKALIKASEATGCRDLLILTWDEVGEEQVGKLHIRIEPIWRWMLGRPSMV